MGILIMKTYLLTLLSICFIGCSSIYTQPTNPGADYRWYIERWQQQIKSEGWTESLVTDVTKTCLMISKYKPDDKQIDHWMSYQEFQKAGFVGDCEDISTFMYGTLKRIGYPYGLKMRIIRMPSGDHAVLMAELPGGKWKMYNSLPIPGDFVDLALARTVVEWDEDHIEWH